MSEEEDNVLIDDIIKQLDNIKEEHETRQKIIDETLNEIHSNIDLHVEELNEDRADLVNSIYAFQKLSFYYEDLSNDSEKTMNCSLMTTAYNDLSGPTDEYNHFVRFLTKHKRRILSYEGIEQYIQKLQNKVANLNDIVINSKLGNDLDLDFIK